jgi:hypothetical protein
MPQDYLGTQPFTVLVLQLLLLFKGHTIPLRRYSPATRLKAVQLSQLVISTAAQEDDSSHTKSTEMSWATEETATTNIRL